MCCIYYRFPVNKLEVNHIEERNWVLGAENCQLSVLDFVLTQHLNVNGYLTNIKFPMGEGGSQDRRRRPLHFGLLGKQFA